VVGLLGDNGLGDPVFEAEGAVHQRHYVMIWGIGCLIYYQIGREVEEAVFSFLQPPIAEEVGRYSPAWVQGCRAVFLNLLPPAQNPQWMADGGGFRDFVRVFSSS
jgi:hypothetical protein